MISNKLILLINQLEKEELESENGVSPQLYLELFTTYLCINNLVNARYIWKRIPANIKKGNTELERMHLVFLALWNNNTVEFFKAANFEWSKNITSLIGQLKEKIQQETIELIGKAYSSIFENVLIEMTNVTPEKIDDTCVSLGWKIETGHFPRLIYPRKKQLENTSLSTCESQLFTLTDFVSFLEN